MLQYDQLLAKALEAARGGHAAWVPQSSGEKVAVALVLNRADWLAEVNVTLPQAIDILGPVWLANVPKVENYLRSIGEL